MKTLFSMVTNSDLDALKDKMQIYQDNINNNITWFYAALAIVIAVLIVSLIGIVRASIKSGIERGVKDIRDNLEQRISVIDEMSKERDAEIRYLQVKMGELSNQESGEWTPYLTEGVHDYNQQIGYYHKAGNLVILWYRLEIFKTDKSIGDGVTIGGIPFVSETPAMGNVLLINMSGKTKGICLELTGELKKNETGIRLFHSAELREVERLLYSSLNGTIVISGTFIYQIAKKPTLVP